MYGESVVNKKFVNIKLNSRHDKRQRGESCLLSGELYMNNRVWQNKTKNTVKNNIKFLQSFNLYLVYNIFIKL